ncbi:transmembrane protein 71 isoform X2 [Nerophis ophidion]|nr:transmembrane protein 71 isoform X2 [Nerophis ophidion]XP_061776681.1 transmembrane protein 71 isoform X2 [Nerophis ophidion]XP_061776682.1 transmembrane protein 71 isoform X2 [Nerophis ophidion]XP_061776683.1 transmembrane protein 71 isoform X2 [Nerophis ophidion]
MSLFFSGAVTSSPIKKRLRSSAAYQSLDVSLLSPDSSYVCDLTAQGSSHRCCCRRSPRLLTNGYYAVTHDSFLRDDHGNVSLMPCTASVSYKENVHRVFRRRRRPRSSLVRLLSGVSETCQSWLDHKVFRGMFGTSQELDQDQDQDRDQDREPLEDWARTEGFTTLEEPSLSGLVSPQPDDSCNFFTYDPTEAAPPTDKMAQPSKKILLEICSEVCQSKEHFTQSIGGLSEVPPPSAFYTNDCLQVAPERTAIKTLAVFMLAVFVLWSCFPWSVGVMAFSVLVACTTLAVCALVSRSGQMGRWRQAKTEDITSRNE